MRSRRVILRLAPYVLTFGLLGSTLAWQDTAAERVADDLGAAGGVVVDEYAIPTVKTDVPVEPAPRATDGRRSAQAEGGAEAEPDGSVPEPSAKAPVVIAELTPQKVTPFSLVGVTWASGVPQAAEVEVRWRGKDGWSTWTDVHQDIVPDEGGRPGTEPQWVKWADQIAVRVISPVRSQPVDLRIAAVNPGEGSGIVNAAATQPRIIMRSQWGARPQGNCSDPIYGSQTLGSVIHHTVGSNSYTAAQSAGIVRSIQAYHMNSRNWCDIGYNFLVDRYGQIFEGRGGGINRQVRAAHSGNAKVNEMTMGVSLMGTFDNAAPTAAMKEATARLVAWRFASAHIPAKGLYSVGGKTLNRIAGHRDVISTACPGAYVYAWISARGGLRDRVAQLVSGSVPPSITGFRSAVRSSSVIDYGWNPVKNTPRYQLLISRSPRFSSPYSRIVGPNHVRIAGLVAGAAYYAKVRALSPSGGGKTAWSVVVARRTLPPGGTRGIPSGLHASARSSSSMRFVWNPVPGAARYQIRLSRSPSMASSSSQIVSTRYAQYGALSPQTTYYVQVRAISRQNTLMGAWSRVIAAGTSAVAKRVAFTPTREVAVPSSGSYTFRGHGYGHGIGMGQYGAAGAASSGKTYWSILAFYYPGTTQVTRSATIRVLITADTTRNVKVKAKPGIAFRIGSGSAMALPTSINGATISRWSIEPESGAQSSLRYKTDSYHTYRTWSGPARFEAPTLDLILPDESVRTYRTSLVSALPFASSSGRDTVNALSLEDYTRGVVPREMPSTFATEALKAQSVAARTYGARYIRTSSYYDICDTTSCQVYGGASAETATTDAAVTATAAQILTYQGLPAFTQFSASTGGYTDVGSQPYLSPGEDPWDAWSGNPRHSWTASVSASAIASKYPGIGTLKALQVTDRNGYGDWGGRVRALKLIGSKGTQTITGNAARFAFGLRSNWFTF
ncbi:MAG TPA: SpoIID/LytB domain-containing protein [Aeromicrobium sp.]|nr:SpoIID/LytB domain-containing protein [Aeromicrobium sp.]